MHGKTPLSLAAPQADEWFNSVHLWRRNRDGHEESTGGLFDEVRRIAANIAKPPTPRWPRSGPGRFIALGFDDENALTGSRVAWKA
jgi:hypothetical protein